MNKMSKKINLWKNKWLEKAHICQVKKIQIYKVKEKIQLYNLKEKIQ
jgi:hypothetical protein